jgi:small subunit ribosomal protein S6
MKGKTFMPQYELMYILASSVSDDQVPSVTEQVKTYVSDFGGQNLEELQLGKKKLAYPIKKTRNGFYGVVTFDLEGKSLAALDAKIRTQKNTIIRYLIVNLDEHVKRSEKDKVAQSSLTKQSDEVSKPSFVGQDEKPVEVKKEKETTTAPVTEVIEEVKETAPEPKAAAPIELNEEELDKKIEAALGGDLIK